MNSALAVCLVLACALAQLNSLPTQQQQQQQQNSLPSQQAQQQQQESSLPSQQQQQHVPLSLGGGFLGREKARTQRGKAAAPITLRAASVGHAVDLKPHEASDVHALFRHFQRHAATALGLSEAIANANDGDGEGGAAPIDQNAVDAALADGTDGGAQHFVGISVDVQIGSPAQTQTLLLNFFTSHFWVVSQKFILSKLIKNRFDESLSTTLFNTNEQFRFAGYDYGASGSYAIDSVTVGSLKLEKQRLGVADSVSLLFPALGVNGVLGLAASADGSGESSLANLLEGAPEPVLTLYHNPLATVLSSASNALYATFGGWDDALCEDDWKAVDATNDGSWQVDIYGLSIDENPRKNVNAEKALIVSTLPVTLVPHRTIKHLANILDAVEVKQQTGVYALRCSGLPTLHLNLGSQRVPIQPENYIVKVAGVCFLRVFEISEKVSAAFGGVQFVLAEPLLRSNCVQFDPEAKQISFATPIPQPLH